MRKGCLLSSQSPVAFWPRASGPVWPNEYFCPISNKPMFDPVIISTGHTYERHCILAWLDSGQTHCFVSGQPISANNPDTLIPNLCLSSSIQRFCESHGVSIPPPPSISDARRFVDNLVRPSPPLPPPLPSPPIIEPRVVHTETCDRNADPNFPLSFGRPTPRLSSSNEYVVQAESTLPSSFTQRLRSFEDDEQEEAARDLRHITRTNVSCRKIFASDESLLVALLDLAVSSATQKLQSDCVATIVNLSLEKENKARLMRAGVLEPLVETLCSGCPAARGHAAAAIFNLAVEEENRTVIAVVGAIPPLLRLLLISGDGTMVEDTAMALYYLSLQKANKSTMVISGAVPILVRRARDSAANIRARCFMIMGSLAVEGEGRKALVGSDALACARDAIEKGSESGTLEQHALAFVLVMVGRGRMRLADSGPESSLTRAIRGYATHGTGRTKEKAVALLRVLKEDQAGGYDDDDGAGGGGSGRSGGGFNPPPASPGHQGGYLGNPVGRNTFAGPNRVAGFGSWA